MGNRNYIDFSADFTAKDNRIRIIFENLVYSVWNVRAGETVHGPTNVEDVAEIDEKCLSVIRTDMVNAVYGTTNNTRTDDF